VPDMLRPQKFEFDARDLMADDGCHMPNADCSLYFGLRPPSSVLLQQSTSPRTLPLPTHPHAIPEFSLHASTRKPETNTGRPTLSASPPPTARGDPLFASSNHYLVFFCLCLGSGLKKLGFAKIKNLPPTDSLFYLNPKRKRSTPISNILYPINHLYPNPKKPPQQSALLSKKFYSGKRGKMPILGP
jgi:hypothetical protein